MKFVYFYSDVYEYYNKHIHENLDSIFEVESIKIDDIQNNGGHTFFGGVSIKIELILHKIKENMGNSIIFTDATIFIHSKNVNQIAAFFNNYLDNDLCFADNDGNGYYNIGIILIKCDMKTLTFFENVLDDLKNSRGWDQDIINKHLCNNENFKTTTFDRTKIYCNWDFNPSYRETFLIYKSFIHHDKNININFNKRLQIFKQFELITEEEYNANCKMEFNPSFYKSLYADLQNMTDDEAARHYKNHGCYEKRVYSAPADFNPAFYKSLYADLQNMTDDEAARHYINHGCYEKRVYRA
jgi:hypothetical protein